MVDYYSTHFQGAICRNIEKELVFTDIECDIDDSRTFTPNFICFEREASDVKYVTLQRILMLKVKARARHALTLKQKNLF